MQEFRIKCDSVYKDYVLKYGDKGVPNLTPEEEEKIRLDKINLEKQKRFEMKIKERQRC